MIIDYTLILRKVKTSQIQVTKGIFFKGSTLTYM